MDSSDILFQVFKDRIARNIRSLLSEGQPIHTHGIIRLEVPCPGINCLDWLMAQGSQYKVYWSNRDNTFEMAGLGAADSIRSQAISGYNTLFEAIHEKLSLAGNEPHYYGGIGFYPPRVNSGARKQEKEWKEFGAYYFLLPQFEIITKNEKTVFACNIVAANVTRALIEEYLSALDNLSFAQRPSGNEVIPAIRGVRMLPDKALWRQLFSEHVQPSGKMAYQKIVLARKTCIELTADSEPLVVFRKLVRETPRSFHYYFQPQAGNAFFGASPERLFTRHGRAIESEALAGTMPRGASGEEDAAFEKKLLSSDKDALEHKIVAEAIKNAFQKLCVSFSSDDAPTVVKASSGQHLITRFKGILKDETDDAQILSLLHPTPAVGGTPTEQVLQALINVEPFDRGWYAGAFGYIGTTSVDFTVALRCALMRANTVNLFAGAGIVEGSTADEEWQEIEEKKRIFLRILSS